jgi:TPR repeat protein
MKQNLFVPENPADQYNLGKKYFEGKNYTQAVYYYRKAAEQEYTQAQDKLGFCYVRGLGVSQDYKQAVYWYQKAVERGYVSAQNSLGICYEYGHGVPQDYIKAVYWYKKAAE